MQNAFFKGEFDPASQSRKKELRALAKRIQKAQKDPQFRSYMKEITTSQLRSK